MNKIISLFLVLALLVSVLCACGDADAVTSGKKIEKTTNAQTVVVTVEMITEEQTETVAETTNRKEVTTTKKSETTIKTTQLQYIPKPRKAERLSVEKALTIRQDYLVWLKLNGIEKDPADRILTLDDIKITAYYGKYGNAEFLKINMTIPLSPPGTME